MNEDAAYRLSSQYRFWSFTPAKLAELRNASNALAADHMFKALSRRRMTKAAAAAAAVGTAPSSADVTPSVSDSEAKNGKKEDGGVVDPLSVHEEVELLKYYCHNLLELGTNEFRYSTHVTATAIQFLRRFYLTHSLMEYAPKKIMPTALFLANKTDNQMHTLQHFLADAHKVHGLEATSRKSVLGPEFLFTQALRFHFDVRHPYRALKGITLEAQQLIHICHGHDVPAGFSGMRDYEIRETLLPNNGSPQELERRVLSSYDKAKDWLSTRALISDAYFHYSPSQIAFAAWYCVDSDFITNFLSIKLSGVVPAKDKHRIQDAIASCAKLLQDFTILDESELKAMNKKMLKANKATAQDASDKSRKRPGDAVDENKAKKRKLEREAFEKQGNDLFGPSLPSR